MPDEQVKFLIRDSVDVPLDPIGTFDKRVRAALLGRWQKVDSIQASGEAYDAMLYAGLMKDDNSPASYMGKTVFIGREEDFEP